MSIPCNTKRERRKEGRGGGGKERKKLKEETKYEFQKEEENNSPMDYSEIYYWFKKNKHKNFKSSLFF